MVSLTSDLKGIMDAIRNVAKRDGTTVSQVLAKLEAIDREHNDRLIDVLVKIGALPDEYLPTLPDRSPAIDRQKKG